MNDADIHIRPRASRKPCLGRIYMSWSSLEVNPPCFFFLFFCLQHAHTFCVFSLLFLSLLHEILYVLIIYVSLSVASRADVVYDCMCNIYMIG